MQWYDETELSYLSCPEVFTGTINFELVKQIQDPGRCPLLNPVFAFGQVVWRRRTFPTLGGCKLEYDPDPYIIITQCFTTYHYVLMTNCGRVYLHLVPPEQLEPL